jgi:hypothetical protein
METISVPRPIWLDIQHAGPSDTGYADSTTVKATTVQIAHRVRRLALRSVNAAKAIPMAAKMIVSLIPPLYPGEGGWEWQSAYGMICGTAPACCLQSG